MNNELFLANLIKTRLAIEHSISHVARLLALDDLKLRAGAALAVSVVADALDYALAPLTTVPILGDIPDAIVTGMLFGITRSKRSTLLNLIEFVPVVGDLVPTYTITTLLWIFSESKKKQAIVRRSSSLLGSSRPSSSHD